MSLETELLKTIVTKVGGDVDALPDNLLSTHYEAIIKACGGNVDELPDRLPTTYLKRIAEVVGNGGGSESSDKKLTAMCFNVQRWGQTKGGGSGNYACVKEIFDKYKPDIVGFQEYWNDDAYCFPSNPDVNVKNYLQSEWDHLYVTSEALASSLPQFTKAIVSNFESKTNDEVRYNETYGSEGRSYQKIKIDFYGKEIAVYNTHLDYYPTASNATETSARYLQAKQLFDAVANDEYFIIIGDFNTICTSTSDKDYQMIIKQFVDAGYNVANNTNKFGFNTTWTEGNPATDEQTDNIITSSNITIDSVTVDQTKLNYETPYDHLPLVATLTVKMTENKYIRIGGTDELPDDAEEETLAIVTNQTEGDSIQTLNTELPVGARCVATAAVGSKCYLFGGVTKLDTINIFDAMDNSIRTSSTVLPTEVNDELAIAVGTKIYVLGCYRDYNDGSPIYEFDTETEKLTTLDCTMWKTYAASGAAIGDKIYVFGGYGATENVGVLDTTQKTFTMLTTKLPVYYMQGATAQAVGDKIYIFGGHGRTMDEASTHFLDTIYEVSVVDDTTVNFTLLSAKLPVARNLMASARIGTDIYLFGGQDKTSGSNAPTDAIYKFNTIDKTIEVVSGVALPTPMRSMGAASVGNNAYLFGGYSASEPLMPTINMFSCEFSVTLREAYMRKNGLWFKAHLIP